jgi:hypothetical protein
MVNLKTAFCDNLNLSSQKLGSLQKTKTNRGEPKMARTVIFGLLVLALAGGACFAQDPGQPDSIIFGNVDGSMFLASLNADMIIPVWAKTDDSVAFVHCPLGSHNQYITNRNGGTIFTPLTLWDDCSFLAPNVDYPIAGVTNQSLIGWADIGGQPNPILLTNYAWVKIAEFRIHTTSDPTVLGDTTELFPGANQQNGTLIFSDATGSFNWIPKAKYAKIYFPPNDPPVYTSPTGGTYEANRGFEVAYTVDCTDPNGDPLILTVDFPDPNYTWQQLINVAGHIRYKFSWVIPNDADSSYNLRFTVNDGQGGVVNRDLVINVSNVGLVIGSTSAIPGASIQIPVSLNNSGYTSKVGAFEILIHWDSQILTLSSVTRTGRLGSWEYFHVTMNDAGPGSARIVGIADMVNGPVMPPLAPGSGAILNLNFAVSAQENWIGVHAPIQFLTQDLTDNTLADSSGYVLVYPGLTDGGVNVLGPGQVLMGDINLNGIAYETADFVLFVNHLINPSAFPFTSVQTQATDINTDGLTLTVADLVYLLNIINGNILPPLKPAENSASVELLVANNNGVLNIQANSNTEIAALYVKINHAGLTLAQPHALCGLEMAYFDNGQTMTVLMYDPECHGLPQGESPLFNSAITAGSAEIGSISITEIQAADPQGRLVGSTAKMPDAYELFGSYPNPFNSTTKISFAIANKAYVDLDIFDVTGRLVKRLAESEFPAGRHELLWNGQDDNNQNVASGIYFYRIKVDNFTEVNKTTLIK